MDDLYGENGRHQRATLLDDIFATPAEPTEQQPATIARTEPGKFRKIRGFAKTYAHALKDSVYILAVGPLSDSGRRAIENVSVLAASARAAESASGVEVPLPLVPKIPAHTFMNLAYDVVTEKAEAVHGNVSLLELLIICKMVRAVNPAVSFEIGTFDGRTTLNIAANTDENGKVFTLDLPRSDASTAVLHLDKSDLRHIDKDESGSVFAGNPLKSKITQLYGDSATFDFSRYRKQVDLIFIDGSHSYEYVLSDSERAMEMVNRQGVIFWHDYGAEWWPGVTQALNELYMSDKRFRNMRHIEGTSLVVLWHNSVSDAQA